MISPSATDLLGTLARHRVAANLLMVMMLLAGVWALSALNTQFFPTFSFEQITVSVAWRGSAPEDVEETITAPLERELRTLPGLRQITATSTSGSAVLSLEYEDGTDMGPALDEVKQRVEALRNLPENAERPQVNLGVRYEPVARVVLSGDLTDAELRLLARRFERELLDLGIARVNLNGLAEEELAIQIDPARLQELGLSLPAVAARIAELSRDLPAGVVGRDNVARQLRSLDQRRDPAGFAELPLLSDADGQRITVGDVASLERRHRPEQTRLSFRGQPAVEMEVQRTDTSDSLESASLLRDWLESTRPTLPPGVELVSYAETWKLIRERLMLLLKNGAGGLVLVVLILFLFLDGRVAAWVAAGIPVSFMATLAVLYLFGGSINMISLFALIMALGIIVDDAIVVGEDAAAHHQRGEDALQAAEGGARRMLGPVLASSLTTIAAFMPLMLVGGVVGNILFDIPLVIVCTIIASLLECFLVLPGHLRFALQRHKDRRPSRIRARLDAGFGYFRDQLFRPLVMRAVLRRWTTLASAVALMIVCAGLLAGGRISFTFFPQPEGTILYASASFVAGTPRERVDVFLTHLRETLEATDTHFGGGLVEAAVSRHGRSQAAAIGGQRGDQFGSMRVELTEPDTRAVRVPEFLTEWRARVRRPAGLESLSLFAQTAGPPGRDLAVRLTGVDADTLKTAAGELANLLAAFSGVSAVEDDMPFGREQLVYSLTPGAEAMGFTVEAVGRQLRAAYDGQLVQLFQDGQEEVEVRVMLPGAERGDLLSLERLTLMDPTGEPVPLANVVELRPRQGFESLRRRQGQLAVEVSADVDTTVTNSNAIIQRLREELPELASRHGVEFSFQGRRADQEETLGDMRRGGLFALALIYLILAWIFASYGWPLVVMSAIPFGVVGAILGHWLLGLDLTVLSLFGIFGLSGIVINDSIILVMFFKELRAGGMSIQEALVEAACQRLRAVLLTSLTTIAGLLPLLFETSLQAQFLIPMAVSISFGLGFATFLVLFFIPALLSVHESAAQRLGRARQPANFVAAGADD